MTGPIDMEMLERIAAQTRPDGDCIVWTGGGADGYGRIRIDGVPRPVHRLAYEAVYGPVPSGLQMDHLCRNRRCVRLDHLEPVTPYENMIRGFGGPATNRRKTHCIRGHEFTQENTYVTCCGQRQCRACQRIKDARRRAEKRAQA